MVPSHPQCIYHIHFNILISIKSQCALFIVTIINISQHLLRTFESATIWPLTFAVRATHFTGWSHIPWYALLVSAALVHLCQQTTGSPLWISRLHVAGQRLETVASPDVFRLRPSPLLHLWSSFSHDCMQKKLPLKKSSDQTHSKRWFCAPTLQDVAWIASDG